MQKKFLGTVQAPAGGSITRKKSWVQKHVTVRSVEGSAAGPQGQALLDVLCDASASKHACLRVRVSFAGVEASKHASAV